MSGQILQWPDIVSGQFRNVILYTELGEEEEEGQRYTLGEEGAEIHTEGGGGGGRDTHWGEEEEGQRYTLGEEEEGQRYTLGEEEEGQRYTLGEEGAEIHLQCPS